MHAVSYTHLLNADTDDEELIKETFADFIGEE